MNLFKFELKKLLLNRRSLIFIAILGVFYFAIGFGNSLFSFGGSASFSEYSGLADNVTGSIDKEFASTSTEKISALNSLYGSAHHVMRQCSNESMSKLEYDYFQFSSRYDAYYNGSYNDDPESPNGIYPLEKKLDALKADNKTDTYQYKKLDKQLNTLNDLGEPEFANVVLWESLFEGWNGIIILILLFFPLAFLVSSVFTKEATSGMDNLILSSINGRASILAAKMGSVAVLSIILSLLYFTATFLGNFIPYMSLTGYDAPVRCLSFMSQSPLDMNVLSFALLNVLWVTLVALVFGFIATYISSKLKNHAAVFGVGIIILLLGLILESLGTDIVEKIQLLVDFSFINTIDTTKIFGSFSSYNVFGQVIPYWVCSVVIFFVLIALATIALIKQQKSRVIA